MYKRILVALDGSRAARLALHEALKMARAADGTVIVLAVVEHIIPIADVHTGFFDEQAYGALAHEAAEAEVERAKERCTRDHVMVMSRVIDSYGQRAANVIVDAAAELEADVIAMGTHGRRGGERLLLGSVAESVLRLSEVPVLAVRDDSPEDAREEALTSDF